MVPKQEYSWRVYINLVAGLDFDGGHLAREGLDPVGNVIQVPLHGHEVSVDLTRVEAELQYTVAHHWDVWLRLPYEIKRQSTGIAYMEPTSPVERAAIQRNSQIHHRDETYEGVSDPSLLAAHWRPGVLTPNSVAEIAFGITLPAGATEPDPFNAGETGSEHLHIQFGTGTFDPLLEGYYAAPLLASVVFRSSALGRFPFYENNRNYRGPVEVITGLGLSYHNLSPQFSLQATYSFFFQGYGYWDGVRDANSGLLSHGITLGATADLPWQASLAIGFRHPLAQRTRSEEGDAFEQGPTFLLTLAYSQ